MVFFVTERVGLEDCALSVFFGESKPDALARQRWESRPSSLTRRVTMTCANFELRQRDDVNTGFSLLTRRVTKSVQFKTCDFEHAHSSIRQL